MSSMVEKDFKSIGVVGAGSMGSMMAQLFAENDLQVFIWDVNGDNVDEAVKKSQASGLKDKVTGYKDHKDFTSSLKSDERKLFVFSITHGSGADEVLAKIKGDMNPGDIILDGGNEFYRTTERRQKELQEIGVTWIGMGVSGGYQSARRGPSMSPGGDQKTIETILPLLRKFAAKDTPSDNPCVAYIGPRGAGHYVKMVHNGIETGMLSAICEAWALMHRSLGMSNDEIGNLFAEWNSNGKMRNTYLVQIASEICKTKKTSEGDGHGEGTGTSGYVLDDILDKVVQDDDGSEGTCEWSVREAADRHVSCPSIAAAQFFRVASGDRDQRLRVAEKMKLPQQGRLPVEDKKKILSSLHEAVYGVFLASYCQGLELIARASVDEGWDINLGTCIKIWRAGCIIQEEYIADLLEPILKDTRVMNIKLVDEVAAALHASYSPLKSIVQRSLEIDAVVPVLSAPWNISRLSQAVICPRNSWRRKWTFSGRMLTTNMVGSRKIRARQARDDITMNGGRPDIQIVRS